MVLTVRQIVLFCGLLLTSLQSIGGTDSTFRRFPGYISPAGPYRPSETRTIDLLHTSLKLDLNWARQTVEGQAVLTLKPYFYPQDSVVLDARAFQIKEVLLVDQSAKNLEEFARIKGQKLAYTYDQFKIRIALGKTYHRSDTLHIAISYTAQPNEAEKLTVEGYPVEKGLYFINPDGSHPYKPRQIWTQGETTGGSSWFPTLEIPNEKYTQDILIRVEKGLRTLSNGLLIQQTNHNDGTRTDHWRQSLPHAPYLTALVVGDFAETLETTKDGLVVSYYVEPAYAPYAKDIFGRTPEMIDFFARLFDVPYVWEKYAQVAVRDFVAGAMENTTLTVLKEGTQKTRRELIDGNSDALIAHELVHHWFGNLVTCEEWGQLPLNEAFANYAEYLWEEYKQGKKAANWLGYLEMQEYFVEYQNKKVELIRYFYEHPDHMFDSHSYAKGGRILHMLRKYLGDDAFFSSLSHYLKQNQFGTAELAQLRIAIEQVSGKDMNWFFDQWFYRPGHPELNVKHYYDATKKVLRLDIEQVQDTLLTTVYRLPTAVDLWIKGSKIRHQVVVDRTKQTFEIPVETRPDLVVFDGDCALVGVIQHEKTREEWMYQLSHSDEFLTQYSALQWLGSHLTDLQVRELVAAKLNDPFWKIRQEAIYQMSAYDGPGKQAIEQVLVKLVTTDPHPMVRGEALLALESLGIEKHLNQVKRALEDSSYAVVSTALGLIAKTSPEEMPAWIERFKGEKVGVIAAAVGDYFGDNPKSEHLIWFTEMLDYLGSNGGYGLLPSFGKFIVRIDPTTQEKALRYLEEQARSHPGMSIRYGAYQILSWFDDRPGIKNLLSELRSNEKNLQLLDLYKALHGE